MSAARGDLRLAGKGCNFILRQAGLLQVGARVLAERRHASRRRHVGARHAERQVEHLEGAAAVLDLGQCTAVGNLRIAQRLGDGAIGR